MHPLRVVYRSYIKRTYGLPTGAGSDLQAELAAEKVSRIGLPYKVYVELACTMLDDWASGKGWPFPYWSVVISDSTVQRVRKFAELYADTLDLDDNENLFHLELMYATGYVHWFCKGGKKPTRMVEVPPDIKVQVAEHICNQYGVECISSNYNLVALSIERSGKLG